MRCGFFFILYLFYHFEDSILINILMNEPLNIEQDRKNRDKIKISGRGAVGSARGSGLRGRQFKSGRPDHLI